MDINFCHSLEKAMQDKGFYIKGNINYQKEGIQRFRDANRKKGRDLFVILHGHNGATFGDWHDEYNWVTWWLNSNTHKPTAAELTERHERQQTMQRVKQHKRNQAIYRATRFWHGTISDNAAYNHPYIRRKGITPYTAKVIESRRCIKDLLIVPIRNVDFELQTIQVIRANGFKRCWRGTTYKDNMIWLHPKLPANYKGVIWVCEGYATGCSIFKATSEPTICALSASNLVSVAILLRRAYVHACIKIAADNDFLTPTPPGNVGVNNGRLASSMTGASLHYPIFENIEGLDLNKKPSDYNDLHALTDKEEVRRQLILIRE